MTMTATATTITPSRLWEIRVGDQFAIAPTELEAWLQILRRQGKVTDLRQFITMVQGLKDMDVEAREIVVC